MLVRSYNKTANTPVAFYGQVVDQDTNPLQNVQVDVAVSEEYMMPSLHTTGSTTNLQRQSGPDGRFEVTGLKGHRVSIVGLAKDAYEPELGMRGIYGMYGAQTGSFSDPVVFRMWSTNIPHEKLITGEKWSAVIPDGRRYGVDLINATIAEGTEGDLVVWLKRPAAVGWEKYDWSCELRANGGGLQEETSDNTMLVAPETGYTNLFTCRQEADHNDWTHGLYGKRFYIRLRNGQIYGRITVTLSPSPNRQVPATLRVEYVINPSGSRLLR